MAREHQIEALSRWPDREHVRIVREHNARHGPGHATQRGLKVNDVEPHVAHARDRQSARAAPEEHGGVPELHEARLAQGAAHQLGADVMVVVPEDVEHAIRRRQRSEQVCQAGGVPGLCER